MRFSSPQYVPHVPLLLSSPLLPVIIGEGYKSLNFSSCILLHFPVTSASSADITLHAQSMLLADCERPSFTFIHPMLPSYLYVIDGRPDITSFSDMLRRWTQARKSLNFSNLPTPGSFQCQRFSSFSASVTFTN
jgi:hypothetical protein